MFLPKFEAESLTWHCTCLTLEPKVAYKKYADENKVIASPPVSPVFREKTRTRQTPENISESSKLGKIIFKRILYSLHTSERFKWSNFMHFRVTEF